MRENQVQIYFTLVACGLAKVFQETQTGGDGEDYS